MKQEFDFFGKPFTLEMDGSPVTEGEFQLCRASVGELGAVRNGVFKLTKTAWEAVNKSAEGSHSPLGEKLITGCVDAIKAELYVRPIPNDFSYLLDHRYFDKPPGWD